MILTDILYDALDRVNSAQLAGVIGTDGLRVEIVMLDGDLPHDEEIAETELAYLAATASATASRMGVGWVNNLIVETDYLTYLLAYVVPGYYVVLGVDPGSSLGRARFALRQIVDDILNEL